MKKREVNSLSLIFQKIVKQNLVEEILQTSIFTVYYILIIDSENKNDIKVLDEGKNKKLLIHLLAKCLTTNLEYYTNNLYP